MPNKHYLRGRAFEYQIKKLLQDNGFTVTRAAGSHSPFDLIAVKPGKEIWFSCFLQLKTYKDETHNGNATDSR